LSAEIYKFQTTFSDELDISWCLVLSKKNSLKCMYEYVEFQNFLRGLYPQAPAKRGRERDLFLPSSPLGEWGGGRGGE
jgi:hypothetical protein